MKIYNRNIAVAQRFLIGILLCTTLILVNSCVKEELGWDDARYKTDFEFYVYHTNPVTGIEYTDEELAELTYNPLEQESYSEGQNVELAVVTSKRPAEIKVLLGSDLSELASIKEFSEFNGKIISKTYTSTLEALKLLEIGDKETIKFSIVYEDGAIGAAFFTVRKIKFFDPTEIVDFYVYLNTEAGDRTGLLVDESITGKVADPAIGFDVDFNGIDNKVEIINIPDLNFRYENDFSVGLWVNTTATNSDPSIIGDKDWGSGGNPGFVFAFKGDDGWKLNAGDGSNRIDIDGNAINDGQWHYLMATFDRDGNAVLYEDGVSVGSADMTALGNMESGSPMFLAQDGTGNYGDWFEGHIGDTDIYNYVLSADQVSAVSSSKTGVQFKNSEGTTSNIPVTLAGGSSIENDGGKYTFNFNGTDGLGTIADAGKFDFRSSGDYSVAIWMKTTSSVSDPSMIGDKDWGSGGNKGFVLAYTGGSWKLNAGDGDGNRIDIDGGNIGDGEFHLIGVTFDRDGNATLYEDGAIVGSASMAALGDMTSGSPIRLAQDGTGSYGNWFEGKLANCKVFDYVVSEEEMAALYGE